MTLHVPHISTAARMLGFAGLLPQLGATLLVATRLDAGLGALVAFGYAAVILSFLGGIWWGFAMSRGEAQTSIAATAVIPAIIGFLLVVARLVGLPAGWSLVAIGSALILTLLVDRRLVDLGYAPPGWMGLRVPLSISLGALTILAGILSPATVSLTYSG